MENLKDNRCNTRNDIIEECYITYVNETVCGHFGWSEKNECITYRVICKPSHGTVNILFNETWEYIPDKFFVGMDSFLMIIIDNEGRKHRRGIIICVTPCKEIFKELSIQENVIVPEAKPDIEDILSISVEVKILNSYIVCTSKGISYEGQQLTGYKLKIIGVLKQRMEYVADNKVQSVHVAHFDVPFSTFVVVPSDYCLYLPFKIKACVEDVFYKIIDNRTVFKNITLLLGCMKNQ